MASEIENLKRELRKELRELKSSVEYISKDYEDLKKECLDVKQENAALKASHERMAEELERLRSVVRESNMRLTAQEQYSRKKNVEIKGIPHDTHENLVDVLAKVGAALEEPITADDIEVCHRVPTRKNSTDANRSDASEQNIVMVFKHQTKRDAVMSKARKMRFTTDELGYAVKRPVYVNEHLCPQLKKLLGMTIARKRELNWRFAWAVGGKVYARQTEKSRAIQISCEADLEKMRSAVPAP